MTSNKSYTFEIFRGYTDRRRDGITLTQLFDNIADIQPPPHEAVGGGIFRELRQVERYSSYIRGIFAKYQHSDIPTAAAPGGQERDLGLADDEGLLEKTHFLFYPNEEILVWQKNKHGGTPTQLASHLTNTCRPQLQNRIVAFVPILREDAWLQLMSGNTMLEKVELKVARPTSPDMLPENPWSHSILAMLNATDGATVNLKVSANLRGNNPDTLPERIKQWLRDIVTQSPDVKTAKVQTNADHQSIDLLKGKLNSTREIPMVGRYPGTTAIYQALEETYHEHRQTIRNYLADNA